MATLFGCAGTGDATAGKRRPYSVSTHGDLLHRRPYRHLQGTDKTILGAASALFAGGQARASWRAGGRARSASVTTWGSWG